MGTSRIPLVLQWLRIHLPMQWTPVQFLAQEDPTCHRALSLGATTPEADTFQSPCSATRDATVMRSLCTAGREQPLLPADIESPCTTTKTQRSQNFTNFLKRIQGNFNNC